MHALQISYRMLTDSNLFRLELCALSFFFFWVEFSSMYGGFVKPELLPLKGRGGRGN